MPVIFGVIIFGAAMLFALTVGRTSTARIDDPRQAHAAHIAKVQAIAAELTKKGRSETRRPYRD